MSLDPSQDPGFRLAFIDAGTPEYARAAELRYDALYAQWGLPRSLIEDTDGRVYHHLAAFDPSGEIVGYARLWLEEGNSQVFQVSVDDGWRGRGVGVALMRRLMELAAQHGRTEVTLDARAHVVGFYERLGFVVTGDEFLSPRTGTPHRAMRATL